LDVPWAQIKPCPPEIHLAIAKEFVSHQDEGPRVALSGILETGGEWWPAFWQYVRQSRLAIQWSTFRRQQLIKELEKSLRRSGVPVAWEVGTPGTPGTQAILRKPIPGAQADDAAEIRRIVVKVVSGLPVDELRSLRLPVGDVFDALKKS